MTLKRRVAFALSLLMLVLWLASLSKFTVSSFQGDLLGILGSLMLAYASSWACVGLFNYSRRRGH